MPGILLSLLPPPNLESPPASAPALQGAGFDGFIIPGGRENVENVQGFVDSVNLSSELRFL